MSSRTLNILHWNVNGLQNSLFRLELQILADSYHLDIISLTESHNSSFKIPESIHVHCSLDLNIYLRTSLRYTILRILHLDNICELVIMLITSTVYVFVYLRNGKRVDGVNALLEILSELYSTYFQLTSLLKFMNSAIR